MSNTYVLIHEGRRLGLAYVSPHPDYADHIIVSVIPLERTGKWEDHSLPIHFETPLYDIFPEAEDEIKAVKSIIAQAVIAPSTIQVERQSDLSEKTVEDRETGGSAAFVMKNHMFSRGLQPVGRRVEVAGRVPRLADQDRGVARLPGNHRCGIGRRPAHPWRVAPRARPLVRRTQENHRCGSRARRREGRHRPNGSGLVGLGAHAWSPVLACLSHEDSLA